MKQNSTLTAPAPVLLLHFRKIPLKALISSCRYIFGEAHDFTRVARGWINPTAAGEDNPSPELNGHRPHDYDQLHQDVLRRLKHQGQLAE